MAKGNARRSLWLAALLALAGFAGAPALLAADAVDQAIAISRSGSGTDDFLPPEQAFQVTAEATAPDRIEVSFRVAKGYYLYRDKMKFQAPGATQAALGKPAMPEGETKTDEYFGEQVVYHQDIAVNVPVTRSLRWAFTPSAISLRRSPLTVSCPSFISIRTSWAETPGRSNCRV